MGAGGKRERVKVKDREGRGLGAGEKGRGLGAGETAKGGGGRLGLGNVIFILVFFLKCWLTEPVRFGSVQSVSDFRNRNRTEPEFFCNFLIG